MAAAAAPSQSSFNMALLAEQHEVSKLAKRTIGFDGRDFFNSFDFGLHEPLLAPTGNIPLGLEARISARIRELRSLQIEPVVVFDGMTVSRAVPPLLAQTSVKLAPAWAAAARDAHDDPAIVSAFQKKLVLTHQLASAVMCLLRSLGVEALVAPYLACAQLGKMLQHGVVQDVVGPPSMLLFGVRSVILRLSGESYELLKLDALVSKLNAPQAILTEAWVLSGIDGICAPVLDRSLPEAVEAVTQASGSGYRAAEAEGDRRKGGVEAFLANLCVVRYAVVLDTNSGTCAPLGAREALPCDLADVFGPRLPDALYFAVAHGLISPGLVDVLITHVAIEPPPLVESDHLKRIADSLDGVRGATLGLLTGALHASLREAKLVVRKWFAPARETELRHADSPALAAVLAAVLSDDEVRGAGASELAASFSAVARLAGGAKPAAAAALPLRTSEAFLASVRLQALVLLGYASERGALTPAGEALAQVSAYGDEVLVAAELLRHGVLSRGTPLHAGIRIGSKKLRTAAVDLAARVVGLLQPRLAAEPWPVSASVDQECCCFNLIARMATRAVRAACEAAAASLLLREQVALEPGAYDNLAAAMPLAMERTTALSQLCVAWLSTPAEDLTLAGLQARFPVFVDMAADLRRGCAFFAHVHAALVRPLYASDADVLAAWQAAQALLDARMAALGGASAPQGT